MPDLAEKVKLMDAYYAGAIDVTLLRAEQTRLGRELSTIEEHLTSLNTTTSEWQDILEQAMRFAAQCGIAYKRASDTGRRQLNKAVIDRIEVKDGKVTEVRFQAPFDPSFF